VIFKHNFALLTLLALSFVLRFVNLGYSDYQGDEIKSLFILEEDQPLSEFLLTQRKGPGQFLITFLVKILDNDYSLELLTRLPFAVAGFISVIFFYKLLENAFNKKVAFYASMFFVTNGFLVAFSRISQYQSFVILFMTASIFYLHKSLHEQGFAKKGFLLAFVCWAFSILFHYDGIFILPIMAYLTILWMRKYIKRFDKQDPYLKHLLLSLAVSAFFLALFYIPFVLDIGESTVDYWQGRITGDVSTKLSSSMYLFTVYQPIYVIHFYLILFFAGLSSLAVKALFQIKKFKVIFKYLPAYEWDFKLTLGILVWFLMPFIIMEIVVHVPGTHIYTYLVPAFVFLALGADLIEKILSKFNRFFISSVVSGACLLAMYSFIFLQSYAIFVDNKEEYPWESESFFIWEFHKPTPVYHLSMFGFPYYRNWEGIRDAVLASENNGFYSTNERESISRYFIPFDKSTDAAGHYIYIVNPQSFDNKIPQEKAAYWSERYPSLFTFSRRGIDLVRVYYMAPGTLEEITAKGY